MSVFGNYARYYDLLYQDKDYAGEAQFIHKLIQKHAPGSKTILELGSGTGIHAGLLAKEGYSVHGVDLSEEMLNQAQIHRQSLEPGLAARLSFTHGNVRDVQIGQNFDAVISLFHVVSYHTTNWDLLSAFKNAANHLKPGGIFIFDVWYGPAVLTDRPAVRVKRLENDQIEVTRLAEPTLYPNENLVDVNYHVFIRDKASKEVQELKETHRMRYLFKQELELFISSSGLEVCKSGEWLTDKEPGFDTWGVYFVAKKSKAS